MSAPRAVTAGAGTAALPPVRERQASLEATMGRWEPRRLDEMLDAAAERYAQRPYVITDEQSWTYGEMREWSLAIARGLLGLGVRPGDHVALVMANFPEMVATKFAISRLGAVCVPINFLNRRDELGYVLHQSDAVVLVTMDHFRDMDYLRALDDLAPGWEAQGGGNRLPQLRHVVVFPTSDETVRAGATSFGALTAGGPSAIPPSSVSANALADILYTSGTTGEPKGVMLTHDMLLRTAYGSAYARAFQDARRITFSLPMYHVYGYVEGMLAVLFVGGAIVPQLKFDPAATVAAIERHHVDDVLFIPTMTAAVLDELDREPRLLSSLSSMISSGGISPPGIWDRIDAVFGPIEVTTGYGMTETTASTTVTRPDDPRDRRVTTNGAPRAVGLAGEESLGGPLAVYRVVDPTSGEELETRSIGELVVRGPGVTPGYYKKPEETAAVFDEAGWLHTGDLGFIDEQGYVTLVGRVKECYRCGGEQVVPKEVEDVLLGHRSVAEAYVVAIPDPRMGEVGVAWVVLRRDSRANEDEIVAYCAERLARFKVPRYVLFAQPEEIPTTASGRPRKFQLAERAAIKLGRTP